LATVFISPRILAGESGAPANWFENVSNPKTQIAAARVMKDPFNMGKKVGGVPGRVKVEGVAILQTG